MQQCKSNPNANPNSDAILDFPASRFLCGAALRAGGLCVILAHAAHDLLPL